LILCIDLSQAAEANGNGVHRPGRQSPLSESTPLRPQVSSKISYEKPCKFAPSEAQTLNAAVSGDVARFKRLFAQAGLAN
jgi:hypothetical protein